MSKSNSTRRLRVEDFLVTPESRPGWVVPGEVTPAIGDQVYCAGGVGTVVAVHGKTSDGTRLLQIQLGDEQKVSAFYAASSNVLIAPR